jgi:hypothetical protein
MFWITQSSSGALKFVGTAVPFVLLRSVFSYLQFLIEAIVDPSSVPHVMPFFCMPIAYQVCGLQLVG